MPRVARRRSALLLRASGSLGSPEAARGRHGLGERGYEVVDRSAETSVISIPCPPRSASSSSPCFTMPARHGALRRARARDADDALGGAFLPL